MTVSDAPMHNDARLARLHRERQIYARVIAAMDYPEPSVFVHELSGERRTALTPQALLDHWRRALEGALPETANNLYVHVPFCKSICDFCNYKRLHVSSRAGLDEYVAFMEREARLFAPALRGAEFGGLYVGGGTPSVLGPDQLDRLLTALFESFSFHEGAQKNFEFDPMVMTADRFAVLARFGFTRFSFGIQSLDVEINRLHQRGAQTRSHLEKQFKLLGEHGADFANVDFLLGLSGTTPEQMLREIEEVMRAHQPHELCIYFIYPTAEYVAAHFAGDYAKFREFLAPFETVVPAALAELAASAGYRVGGEGRHAITLSRIGGTRRPARTEEGLFYCDVPSSVHRPLNVLGLGDSARSRIFGRLHYRAEHDHGAPIPEARYVGQETTLRDEMFSYIALVFRDGDELSRPLFARTFGVDIAAAFARPLAKLEALGAARLTASAVTFARQERAARLADLLFFLPEERRSALGELPRLDRPGAAAP
ncbi:MAG: radical SAM protein [Polyangiaceae bacterium]|nr:radical SAM protein [Polyangiaceae bacterium]